MNQSGYSVGTGSAGATSAAAPGVANHERLKRDYLEYLSNKSEEIKEQQDARRYYHGSQWTAKQIKALNARKQPVVTYNRIGRKINAVVGLLEKQRQDPRGFPRTPKHEEGAEIATAVLRYVMDQQDWAAKSPICGLDGAVDGLAGIELILEQGDQGDVEVGFETIDPGSFFYDPRSLKADFSDARYMGIGKWADLDAAIEMYPDSEEALRSSIESGSDLTSNPDSDNKWVSGSENARRVRIIDHWYIKGGVWHWCIYTGSVLLDEGESYLVDEKGKTFCKYIVYSANVDQDGDRYGFVRNMKSSQDEINMRRSKGLHIGNTRRMIVRDGQGIDIEKLRTEAARPDGVMVIPPGVEAPEFDDANRGAELNAQLGFLEDAKQEIENYGFNPALMGSGVQDMSGRAIALQQQAGIAELGPYLLAYKGWKLRVYRAIWNTVQRHWTAERWIRVTDDDNVAEFTAINGKVTKKQPQVDEFGNLVADENGQPVMVDVIDPATGEPVYEIDPATGLLKVENPLGSLDVDIIIDEGPDTINMQADSYETLTVMARGGQTVPPEVLIELSPLAGQVKKKVLDMIAKAKQEAMQANAPGPIQQAGIQVELEGKQRENDKTAAETAKIVAETQQLGAGPQTQMLEQAGKVQDQQFRREEHQMDMQGKRIDMAGKVIGLRAAEAKANQPQPQPLRAS